MARVVTRNPQGHLQTLLTLEWVSSELLQKESVSFYSNFLFHPLSLGSAVTTEELETSAHADMEKGFCAVGAKC